jgi:ABC-type transport system involved in multi-copper enzyme maturation permease subunit
MLGLPAYLYRLVPANPILLRVVQTAGKRKRDLLTRCIYLGLLILLVMFSLLTNAGSTGGGASLAALAKVSAQIFQQLSYMQLFLVAVVAPIFTAGAITQERDSQTYDILLATPLTNGQIVLGTLLSRLFFVIALLISGIPVFSITQIFGGVAIGSIVSSVLIAASTAVVCGALAVGISVLKVGGRRTIFGFYFFLVTYLVALFLLDRWDTLRPSDASGNLISTSYFTAFHPFLALRVIFNDPAYLPPDLGSLPPHLQIWPVGWMLSSPHTFFITFMFSISALLVVPAIVLLRTLAQTSITPGLWLLSLLKLASKDSKRKPRPVWHNPIAWREARTKGSATRATVTRYVAMALGILAALAVVILSSIEKPAAQYISASSYSPADRTLTVFSGDKANVYRVPGSLTLKLGDQSLTVDDLNLRYSVATVYATGNALTGLDLAPIPTILTSVQARGLLLALIVLEVAIILLILCNAAASTVTREKEDGSLDLLLTTPITSRFYIWGKLHGLVLFAVPMLAVPVATVIAVVAADTLQFLAGSSAQPLILPEAVIILPVMLLMLTALAAMFGMHMSLRFRTTLKAVMTTAGILLGITGTLGWCGYGLLTGFGGSNIVSLVFASFSPFTVLTVLLDPDTFGGRMFSSAADVSAARTTMLVCSFISAAVYAAVIYAMYKSMVTNFDMTIRKQSR